MPPLPRDESIDQKPRAQTKPNANTLSIVMTQWLSGGVNPCFVNGAETFQEDAEGGAIYNLGTIYVTYDADLMANTGGVSVS